MNKDTKNRASFYTLITLISCAISPTLAVFVILFFIVLIILT